MQIYNEALSFDDVIIRPNFSYIKSRKDVDLLSIVNDKVYSLPIISANMDTVTGIHMATAITMSGALACLHRFWSIEENVNAYKACPKSWVSIGINEIDMQRADALYKAGAREFIIDVAHGATFPAMETYAQLKRLYPDAFFVIGNFANYSSFYDFSTNLHNYYNTYVDGVKLGVGGGSHCSTRVVTGCGLPLFQTLYEFNKSNYNGLIIADGGIRSSGDIAKALGAGADLCMLGNMLAATLETPGDIIYEDGKSFKKYRGSASKESYIAQNKNQPYISPEGEVSYLRYKGSVASILNQIEGGLRSSLSYVGANNLKEFKEKVVFQKVSRASYIEGTPHGKR